ncbi:Arc family DNA-binding protein [Brucepastera parasyntrophica]|uniref:FitA-like ribbon-helix-helix domain-containing protein n=1 Tax=Brucepastera parasyntrophica TaxID=2880008 RepID=UPI002109CA6D|nr:Arc family DNA-binding protein [Brucepastera parasyntrophica]ULQ58666.1 Arc family DNA-binding protein [Brucepastera parasyntrophica]
MVNLTVRNIPEEILKRVRICAERERRSLNSELLIVIEEGLVSHSSKETEDPAGLLSPAGREKIWNELSGGWKGVRPLDGIISEVYAGRDGGAPGARNDHF